MNATGTSSRPAESVWDYPRPPRLEADGRHVVVEFAGALIADTRHSVRVLETSHPPVFYVPAQDTRQELFRQSGTRTWCEWKGAATYWDLRVEGSAGVPDVAWSYEDPSPDSPRSPDSWPSTHPGWIAAESGTRRWSRSRETSTGAGSPPRSTGLSRARRVRGGGDAPPRRWADAPGLRIRQRRGRRRRGRRHEAVSARKRCRAAADPGRAARRKSSSTPGDSRGTFRDTSADAGPGPPARIEAVAGPCRLPRRELRRRGTGSAGLRRCG